MKENRTNLIPWPRQVRWDDGELELPGTGRILVGTDTDKASAALLAETLTILSSGGVRYAVVQAAVVDPEQAGDIVFQRDPALKSEQYRLCIGDRVVVAASGPEGFFRAAATLAQCLRAYHTRSWLPHLTIADEPYAGFRGLMIDVARHPHTLATLQQLVRVCWFYKIRHLQLHLSDIESFAFPSTAFPQLATPGWALPLADWQALEAFAVAHGVTIIPELDVPGHAHDALKRLCPTRPRSGFPVLNPVSERTFAVLDTLVGELCAVFRASPYIHIGADEVMFAGWANCRDCAAFLRRHGYTDMREAYRHFIVRMNEIVRRHGRRTMVWEGFAATGAIRIPPDVIVQFFDVDYIQPEEALALGHDIVNSSWGPLYVTRGGACPVPMIYQWHPFLFGSTALHRTPDALAAAPDMAATSAPVTFFNAPLPDRYYPRVKAIPPNPENMLGSMLCSWGLLDRDELGRVRRRLAAMSERIWHPGAGRTWGDFSERLEAQDFSLDALLDPILLRYHDVLPDFAPVKRAVTPFVTAVEVSDVQPAASVRRLVYPRNPATLGFRPRCFAGRFCDLHPELAAAGSALVYFRFAVQVNRPGTFDLLLGYDGPVRAWIDRRCVFTDPHGGNPARPDKAAIRFTARRGRHEVVVALDANGGQAYGLFARFQRVEKTEHRTTAGIELGGSPVTRAEAGRAGHGPAATGASQRRDMSGVTPRERVVRAVEHRAAPGRIPFTVAVTSSLAKYGEPLLRLLQASGCDFFDVGEVRLPDPGRVNKTSDVDAWGCRWDYALVGKAGVVSYSPLADWQNFSTYKMPEVPRVTAKAIEAAERMRANYPVWASVAQFFQVMQNLRGTENLMLDFYTQPEELQKLIDRMLSEYHLPAIEEQLKLKPDLIGLGDDWGTQTALFIHPDLWRQFFKPVYKQMIDRCHQGGAKVWFHSCGHTRAILPEWIDLGLDVINPQICCMDVADYGATARGKITIVPDLDRQHMLVEGTPEEVRQHILDVYAKLGNAGGGLIGYAPLEPDIPLVNMQAILETISTYERN